MSAKGNQTPNTPELSETELRETRIDELRERARREGVDNADELRHEQLVDAISRKHQGQSTGGGGGARSAESGAGDGRERSGGGNETPNTPDLSETKLREMRIDELRERARREGVDNADELRHEQLVDAISQRHR